MAIVKSNICNMCGGLLDIDIDRQVYICPFCGVTFDYEYFRKDNVLEIAKKSLNRREFGAAKDAFEYMLQKDPHNFEALRGLILCKCKWATMIPILHESEVFIQPDEPELVKAIDKCTPEYRDYFEQIRQALKVVQSYRKGRNELANISVELKNWHKKLRELETAQYINSAKFSTAVSDFFDSVQEDDGRNASAALLYFGIVILVILGYATFVSHQYWAPIVFVGIILLVILIYNITKAMTDKAIEAAKVPVVEKIKELNQAIKAKTDETADYLKTYKQVTAKIVNTYPMAEPEPVENKRIPNAKPVSTRQSSDFPSARKIH